jgi:hypothetical protein
MSDEFDFVKAFANIDILQVEAMSAVTGRAIGAVFTGMMAAGLTEKQAGMIIRLAFAELLRGVRG